MSFVSIVLMVLTVMAGSFLVGVLAGMYAERSEWNRLIDEGKLPKPHGYKKF